MNVYHLDILLQAMDAGLGSITQKINNNGSGNLRETFIRKRISSPNPVSKGRMTKNSGQHFAIKRKSLAKIALW